MDNLWIIHGYGWWLVSTHLKIWVHPLGWWHSQLLWKSKIQVPVTTNQIIYWQRWKIGKLSPPPHSIPGILPSHKKHPGFGDDWLHKNWSLLGYSTFKMKIRYGYCIQLQKHGEGACFFVASCCITRNHRSKLLAPDRGCTVRKEAQSLDRNDPCAVRGEVVVALMNTPSLGPPWAMSPYLYIYIYTYYIYIYIYL